MPPRYSLTSSLNSSNLVDWLCSTCLHACNSILQWIHHEIYAWPNRVSSKNLLIAKDWGRLAFLQSWASSHWVVSADGRARHQPDREWVGWCHGWHSAERCEWGYATLYTLYQLLIYWWYKWVLSLTRNAQKMEPCQDFGRTVKGSAHGKEGRYWSVWSCDRKRVPSPFWSSSCHSHGQCPSFFSFRP